MLVRVTCSVLLVDDDPLYRALARQVLAANGLEVAGEAATAAEARTLARRNPPEAALIDVGLPDDSGIVLASEFAALPAPPRVVLISSDADAANPEILRRCGAGAFIPKQDLPTAPLLQLLAGR